MKRILIVKTSSLGDLVHNLPVASDIRRHFPHALIDWVAEENLGGPGERPSPEEALQALEGVGAF